MKIVGCDLHTRYQQIAMLDTETGELIERRLEHANGEARAFYAELQGKVLAGGPARASQVESLREGGPSRLLLAGWGFSSLHPTLPPTQCSSPTRWDGRRKPTASAVDMLRVRPISTLPKARAQPCGWPGRCN